MSYFRCVALAIRTSEMIAKPTVNYTIAPALMTNLMPAIVATMCSVARTLKNWKPANQAIDMTDHRQRAHSVTHAFSASQGDRAVWHDFRSRFAAVGPQAQGPRQGRALRARRRLGLDG